jgi:four helix bundle protein
MGALLSEESMTEFRDSSRFTHNRLDACRVAIDLFRGVEENAAQFPNGYADLKDQLRRAAAATVRNLAEGANRIRPRDKAARFAVALGEVGETDAALEMAAVLALASERRIGKLRVLAGRVAAMLHGLFRCQERRPSSP